MDITNYLNFTNCVTSHRKVIHKSFLMLLKSTNYIHQHVSFLVCKPYVVEFIVALAFYFLK